jgi:hypothetical protein
VDPEEVGVRVDVETTRSGEQRVTRQPPRERAPLGVALRSEELGDPLRRREQL